MGDLIKKYGEWALITGASSGIGEEFAKRLAEYGMKLILIARRKERLASLSEFLRIKFGTESIIAPVDLASDNLLNEIKKYIDSKEIGILINNAGFGSTGEFVNCDTSHEINMIKVNCIAPTILTHFILPQMIKEKRVL